MRGTIADIKPMKQEGVEVVQITVVDGFQWLKDSVIYIGKYVNQTPSYLVLRILDRSDWPSAEWAKDFAAESEIWDYFWAWAQNAFDAMVKFGRAVLYSTFHSKGGLFTWRPRDYGYDATWDIHQTDLLDEIGRPQPWEVVRNVIRAPVHTKVLDAINDTLWQLQDTPAILDGATFYTEARFKYEEWTPCGSGLTWGYEVNTQADGGGVDLTADCDLVVDSDISEGARLWLTNNSGSDGYIAETIKMKGTGDAIYAPYIDAYETSDTASKAEYGTRTFALDTRWIEDPAYAKTISDWLLTHLKDPMHYLVVQLEDQPALQFAVELFDRVVLRVPHLSLRHAFRVGGIDHTSVGESSLGVRTVMHLEPYMQEGVDTLDDTFHGCLLTRSASQAIPDDDETSVIWNTEIYDTDEYHGGISEYFAIPSGLGGYYRIWANIHWDGNAAGTRYATIHHDTDGDLATYTFPSYGTAVDQTQEVEITVKLEPADGIRLLVYQDSGGALTLQRNASYTPLFGIEFLGA
jgi:hypothetical protein